MPSRKGKGIVSSGNAGNSSKGGSKAIDTRPPQADAEKPLFPPGSKYPLSLLSERCQKNGWEKPSVETPRRNNGFAFVVTLSRYNSKTAQRDSVCLEPHPSYISATALEARHWGATYALYRFCNGLQLNRVLPTGPREYWNELAAEHKAAPEHMKWMYESDPFAARKAVDARQVAAAQKKEAIQASGGTINIQASKEFTSAPEVKMASELRELVEDSVKKAIALFPEAAEDIAPSVLPEGESVIVIQQLGLLGFKLHQTRDAASFLCKPSTLASRLLASLSPLEAAIEYLMLHAPESDLPARFLPSLNSSNPFILAAHSGTDDIKKRWIDEKATKEAGWPTHVVKQLTLDRKFVEDWELLIATLGRRLIGDDIEDLFSETPTISGEIVKYPINDEEVEALGAQYITSSELVMSLFSAPVKLHILQYSSSMNASVDAPPMYITSASVPPYIRLHLLSRLLLAMRDREIADGEGVLMGAMRILEDTWADVDTNGPPDISTVLQHFKPTGPHPSTSQSAVLETRVSFKGKERRRERIPKRDDRTDAQIRHELESICKSSKYIDIFDARKKLPAFQSKSHFLTTLDDNRVVIVVGETGCGKTTQLPQFILDSLIISGRGSKASIIVTQPRRISAISVAARVSTERLDDGSVGYAIRGESKQDWRTKILFCTTGVVLRRLGGGDNLNGVTHIIVDEVHERTVDGDFLLLELKELLARHPTLKVVLMSATINHEIFVKYFNNAPLLTIPGFTHPVTDIYLEDVIPLIKYRPASVKSKKKNEESQSAFRDKLMANGLDDDAIDAIQNITSADRLDFQLISVIIKHITTHSQKKRGGILIFLPGLQEIRQCIETLRQEFSFKEADIYPLHANLSNEEQRVVFFKTDKWKIIAATNVAETSITIDDVIYVIDAGKVKETQYDPSNNLVRLEEKWVTRAAAKQRRGRAGRTQPGECYKLYTRNQEQNMTKFPIPEILRVPLESVSLTVKAMRENEDVELFLSRAITPPHIAAMKKAWTVLQNLGAIDQEGNLTALGRHMSLLPIDLRLAKMLVLGAIFQCLGPILTVAACLSSKPLFVSPMDKRVEATQARARFLSDRSDLLTDVRAYDECMRLRTEGKSESAVRSFLQDNFISVSALREINHLRVDFLSSLSSLNLVPFSCTPSSPELNINSSNTNLLKAIILGGLWPRVARAQLPKSAIKFDKVQAGAVQRENTAKEFKIFDLDHTWKGSERPERLFLHPGSVLFGESSWKSPFLTYFSKHMTTKLFLRDATEVPLYALLLFGSPISVKHIAGGITVGDKDGFVKLKAWPRIGVLVIQLRRLLDAQLLRCIEEGTVLNVGQDNPVVQAMLALLTGDGLTAR